MIQIDREMPDRCGNCPCFHFENPMYCQAIDIDRNKKITAPYRSPRPEWCPLQEAPSTNDGKRISVKGRMPEPPKEGPDRGKTIKAIEICYTLGHNCTECPLFSVDDCNDKLMHDALSLLKEQEPVKPIIKQEMDDICSCIDDVAYCGECGALIGRLKQNYCHECGRKVKWE